jgi:hypothetical protein
VHDRLSFEERAGLSQNAAGKKLFQLMASKRSNLAVAADVGTVEEMFQIADAVGPHIVVFKTHVDIFDRWDDSIAQRLRQLADKHGVCMCFASGCMLQGSTPLVQGPFMWSPSGMLFGST